MTDRHPDDDRPDGRPRPRYGEYAPEGWVSPVAPPEAPEAAPAVAGRSDASADQAARRPQPAPGAWGAPPRPGAPVLSGGRRFDRVATFLLIGLGGYGVVSNVVLASTFASSLLSALGTAGYPVDVFTGQSDLQRAGAIIAVVSVAVFAVTLIWTIRRLRAFKISFWVPLSAGVIVSILQMALVLAVLFGDAAFTQAILDGAGPSL